MITIAISRTPAKQKQSQQRRPLPWRKILVGLVATAVIVSGAGWGISYWLEAPTRNYVAAIRGSMDPATNASQSDADIVEIMNNMCDSSKGRSIGTDLTDDPKYFTAEMPREKYLAIADEYCASR